MWIGKIRVLGRGPSTWMLQLPYQATVRKRLVGSSAIANASVSRKEKLLKSCSGLEGEGSEVESAFISQKT